MLEYLTKNLPSDSEVKLTDLVEVDCGYDYEVEAHQFKIGYFDKGIFVLLHEYYDGFTIS